MVPTQDLYSQPVNCKSVALPIVQLGHHTVIRIINLYINLVDIPEIMTLLIDIVNL